MNKSIFDKYQLSFEFKKCLEGLLQRQEKSSFKELSKLHFHFNGGKETDTTESVFRILDLFILLTDILDDIEDDDVEKWGIDYNLLVNSSTALYSIIMLELQSIETPYKHEIMSLFSNYLLKATDGQHHDLTNQVTSEEMYFDVVKKKSGSIMALSCTLGETLAIGKYRKELETFAHYVAIIAQIRNDFEDLLSSQKDLISKKRTLPILYLLKYDDEKDSIFTQLRSYYEYPNKNLDFYLSTNHIEKSGLEIYINLIKQKYRQMALELLHSLYPEQDISEFSRLI